MKKNPAFTLVELMIVIAIIAVLASIIMPKMGGARARGKLSACLSNLRHTSAAMEMYANDNKGFYPNDAGAGGGPITFLSTHKLVTTGYLKTNPRCPSSPNGNWSYGYYCPSPYIYYYIYCSSTVGGHAELGFINWYPRWDSAKGMMLKP